VAQPNTAWVTDMTYLWTAQGWLYLAVMIDLFSRRGVGWSMSERIERGLPAQLNSNGETSGFWLPDPGVHQLGASSGRAGRKPRLSTEQISQIEHGLKRGPQALGYETCLWTANRVAHLIEQESRVSYHPGHVWKILRQLGWSCQRPAGRLWSAMRKPSSVGRKSAGRN
jgi:hypothetical protein